VSLYLGRYYDPALDISEIVNREELERRQIERLVYALAVAGIAGAIPRRLGGDATPEELAIDKKRARRVCHVLSQSLKQWTKKIPKLPIDNSIRNEGATIIWPEWRDAHLATVAGERRIVATFAVQREDEKWGKAAIVRLDNEYGWMNYALRD